MYEQKIILIVAKMRSIGIYLTVFNGLIKEQLISTYTNNPLDDQLTEK